MKNARAPGRIRERYGHNAMNTNEVFPRCQLFDLKLVYRLPYGCPMGEGTAHPTLTGLAKAAADTTCRECKARLMFNRQVRKLRDAELLRRVSA